MGKREQGKLKGMKEEKRERELREKKKGEGGKRIRENRRWKRREVRTGRCRASSGRKE